VHIALVDNKVGKNESAIAVAFPLYGKQDFPLGNKLRLLAENESQLTQLNINKWLNRLEDFVHIKAIKPIPEDVTQVCFVRQHVKGQERIEKNMLSKAKHWSEKSGKSLAFCLSELEKSKPKAGFVVPFIWLQSQETKQRNTGSNRKFPLFIKKVEVVEKQVGVFNCYGLSANHSSEGKLVSIPQF
jgi:CRISPR-associated endonuclease Csy4